MMSPVQFTSQANRVRSMSLSVANTKEKEKANQPMRENVESKSHSVTPSSISAINKSLHTVNLQHENHHNAPQQTENKKQQKAIDELKKHIDVTPAWKNLAVLVAGRRNISNQVYSPWLQQHALDCYGIDADIKTMANRMKHDSPIVFVKKD